MNEPIAAIVQPAEAPAEAQPAKEHKWEWRVSAIHKLRVNIKSLTAEAKLIRQEVKRCSPLYMQELTDHRRGRLRREARLAHLALAYLRDRPYCSIEGKRELGNLPNATDLFNKINRLANRNDSVTFGSVERWITASE